MLYFFTRIALIFNQINPGLRPRTDEQYHKMAEIWINKSSKFYEHQTLDVPFKVVLMYHPDNRHIIDSHTWPSYVEFTTDNNEIWLKNNVARGSQIMVTRIDYDDSFATDIFAYMTSMKQQLQQDTIIMYNKIRMYHIESGTFTSPMEHRSSMFISKYIHDFQPPESDDRNHPYYKFEPTSTSQVYGILGDHGKVYLKPHIKPDECYALCRLTGFNAANNINLEKKLGLMGRDWRPYTISPPDPRFITG